MYILGTDFSIDKVAPIHRFIASSWNKCLLVGIKGTPLCAHLFPQPITVGNGALEQPLVYEVYYNGTMVNVTSPTPTLTFTAPSLPDGVFADNITVFVTAINRFGRGTTSDPVNEKS